MSSFHNCQRYYRSYCSYIYDRCNTVERLELAGKMLSKLCAYGDVIMLHGDVGVGKTCFTRGFIASLLERSLYATNSITSPTYLLDNTYTIDGNSVQHSCLNRYCASNTKNGIIHHLDLYRLQPGACSKSMDNSFDLLNIPYIYTQARSLCLIEWPARLLRLNEYFNMPKDELAPNKTLLPEKYINVYIRIAEEPDDYPKHHRKWLVPVDGATTETTLLSTGGESEESRELFITVNPYFDSARFNEMADLYQKGRRIHETKM